MKRATGENGHVGVPVACKLASLGHNVVAIVLGEAASRRLPSATALRVAADAGRLGAAARIRRSLLIERSLHQATEAARAVMNQRANAIEAATATNWEDSAWRRR